MIKIKCFGMSREIVNAAVIKLDNPAIDTVEKLKSWLVETYPAFKTLPAFMVAVNQSYAIDSDTLAPEDEVAIIPPVSGG